MGKSWDTVKKTHAVVMSNKSRVDLSAHKALQTKIEMTEYRGVWVRGQRAAFALY